MILLEIDHEFMIQILLSSRVLFLIIDFKSINMIANVNNCLHIFFRQQMQLKLVEIEIEMNSQHATITMC